jgi:hypothetical protein
MKRILLCCKEAAEYLTMGERWLLKDRKKNKPTIPFITLGKSIRYEQKDLDAYLERNKKEWVDDE